MSLFRHPPSPPFPPRPTLEAKWIEQSIPISRLPWSVLSSQFHFLPQPVPPESSYVLVTRLLSRRGSRVSRQSNVIGMEVVWILCKQHWSPNKTRLPVARLPNCDKLMFAFLAGRVRCRRREVRNGREGGVLARPRRLCARSAEFRLKCAGSSKISKGNSWKRDRQGRSRQAPPNRGH